MPGVYVSWDMHRLSSRQTTLDSCPMHNTLESRIKVISERTLSNVKENTREVACGGNEDVMMDEWSHQAGQNRE